MKPFQIAEDATGLGAPRLKRIALAIVMTALILCAHFLVQARLNQPAPIPIDGQIRDWEYARLSQPDLAALQGVSWTSGTTSLRLPGADHGPAYYAFRAFLDFETPPQRALALGLATTADNAHVYLNASAFDTPGRLEFPATYQAKAPSLLRVPPGLIQPGANELIVLTATNSAPQTAFFTAIYGDYDAIAEATQLKRFLWNDYRYLTMVIALVIGVVAAALSSQIRNRASAFWLAALCFAVAGRSFTLFYLGSYGGDLVRFTAIYLLAAALPFSLFMFIEHWTRAPQRRVRMIAWALFAAGAVAIPLVLLNDINDGVGAADLITDWIMVTASAAACLRLVWHLVRNEDVAPAETAALAVVAILSLWDSLAFLIIDQDAGHLRLVAPVFLIGLVAAILGRNMRIFESLGAFTDELSAQLSEREARIRADFEALTAARKARDLAEERQRILRDMHDGIGGHLTGLVVQVRARRVEMDEVESGIEQALNDLKLVVASLDLETRSFAEALSDLRARIARQLGARDIVLDWVAADIEDLAFSTTDILQISRIIQESVANILRHSNAKRVAISLTGEDGQGLRILIKDDGKPVDAPDPEGPGRGLRSMRTRAAAMGGDAHFTANADGFLVEVLLKGAERPPSSGAPTP
jgi:signal transduction histidine kinase